jgi:hypothetical protein
MTISRQSPLSAFRELPDFRQLPDASLKPLSVRGLPSPERRNRFSRETLVRHVRSEFEEMRGLRLTLAQARCLFCLREDVCARILDALSDEGLLVRIPDGQYRRKEVA